MGSHSQSDPSAGSEGFELVYGCAVETLGPWAQAWTPLARDAGTEQFIAHALTRRQGRWSYWLASALRQMFSDFDVNGLLDLYPLHLLSQAQAATLLTGLPTHSLLDLGAGNGDVTSCLAPLFEQIQTTEHSSAMVRALRRRGYAAERVRIDDPIPDSVGALQRHFDVVACLNVIDRTSHPHSLLRRAASRLNVGGALLVAVPLPLRPFFYDGPVTRDPSELFELQGSTWEAQCVSLAAQVLEVLPELELFRLARCPYLSGGDPSRSLYVLDDLVLVLRRTGGAAN
jgi:2-polyprenyl-3-methyl-5-hydroxy-6-metoxy-1,4-benzoquinol methylase